MPTQECLVGFTRMTQCPACKGLQDSKACNGYCLNVMKGCLAYHSQLDQDWNSFLGEYSNTVYFFIFRVVRIYMCAFFPHVIRYRHHGKGEKTSLGTVQHRTRRDSDQCENLRRYNELSRKRPKSLAKGNTIRFFTSYYLHLWSLKYNTLHDL